MPAVNGFDFLPLSFDANGNLTDPTQFAALQQRAATATDVIYMVHGFRNNMQDATTWYTAFLGTLRTNLARPEFKKLAGRDMIVAAIFWPSKPLPETFGSAPKAEGSTQSVDDDDVLSPLPSLLPTMTKKLEDLKDTGPAEAASLDQAIALLPTLDDDRETQDKFAQLVLASLPKEQLDPTEGIDLVEEQKGSEMFQKLQESTTIPAQNIQSGTNRGDGGVSDPDDFDDVSSEGSVESVGSFFGSILGGVDTFINLTTFLAMKNRGSVVGKTGVAKTVRDLKTAKPALKIQLIGHSLGACTIASCVKALTGDPMVQPDSVTLLEGAFSHYGFSPNNGIGQVGFYRDVIVKKVVKGPFIATWSAQDSVVADAYTATAVLVQNATEAFGDGNDRFGGLGRSGTQLTPESVALKLHDLSQSGDAYNFKTGIITNLDGSGGLIKDHGDITNANVTYAFACAVAAT